MFKKILILLLFLGTAGAAVGFYLFNKPHESVLEKEAEFKMESAALVSDFEADENVANKKYNGKVVEVTGIVSEKSKDDKGKLNISLQGEDLAGIGCVFENAGQEKAGQLKEGDKVKIKGVCTGILMDVVMVDCVVVE